MIDGTSRNRAAIAMTAGLTLIPLASACADVVLLNGGDRLSGKIVSKNGDKLTLETSYAGDVVILWSEVRSISTEQPTRFMLSDGTVMEAVATGADDDAGVVLRSGKVVSTEPIALADVAYINPPPEITGEGVSGRSGQSRPDFEPR